MSTSGDVRTLFFDRLLESKIVCAPVEPRDCEMREIKCPAFDIAQIPPVFEVRKGYLA